MDQIFASLYLSLAVAFLITGILALHYYSREGIISTKKIFKWSVITAVITAPVFAAVLFVYALSTTTDPNLYLWSNAAYGTLISLYIGMFLAVFVTLVVLLFVGFGMIGILSALEKGIAPEILLHISRITPHLSDFAKKKDLKAYVGYSALGKYEFKSIFRPMASFSWKNE